MVSSRSGRLYSQTVYLYSQTVCLYSQTGVSKGGAKGDRSPLRLLTIATADQCDCLPLQLRTILTADYSDC
jgi:hypothetical protein